MQGFTLIEVLLVIGLMGILTVLVVVNLVRPQTSASLDGTVNTLVADIKSQQLKAMSGESLSATTAQEHSIRLQTNNYTLFKGTTYSGADADNFVVTLQTGITLANTFPSGTLIFSKASGEISGFTAGSNTITITNSISGQAKTITLNRYGAITVN